MEPTDSRQAASLPPNLDSPTDPLICTLLVAEPMTSTEIAARLAISARTVRHRLMRLRDAGAVVMGDDGLYRREAGATAALPAVAAPGDELAAPVATPTTRGNVAVLAAVLALTVGCLGVAVWAARYAAAIRPPAPAAPPATPPWPYVAGWPPPSL
jgi:predicted ArsR family transcriptional regulator